jgi:hypothetical protein
MNDHDRSNLNYIMSLSDDEFESWALSVPDDDIQYAMELIRTARTESFIIEQELLDAMEDSDLSEARAVLQKFRL